MSPKVLTTSLSQDNQTVRYVTKGLENFPLSRYSNCQVCHQRFWWLPSLKILKLSCMSPKVLMRTSLSQDTQTVRYVTKGFDDFPLSRYSNCQVCHQRFWRLPSLKILKLSGTSQKVWRTSLSQDTQTVRYVTKGFDDFPLKMLKLSGMSPKVLMTSLSQDTQTVRYVTKGFDDFPLSSYCKLSGMSPKVLMTSLSQVMLKLSGMSPKVLMTSLSQDTANCQVCHQRFWRLPSLKILKLSGMSLKVVMTSLSQDTQSVRYVTKGFDDFLLSRYSNCQVCHQRFRWTSLSQDTQTVRYVTKGLDDFPLSRYSNCQVCHQRFWWLPSLKILKLSGMSPKV